jgi:DNA-binding transcriptional LysR family regulator
MELRHLRYFVAVAEEGSLTVAAQKRLHTAQPSLSRQIHDLDPWSARGRTDRIGASVSRSRAGGAAAGRGGH